MNEDTYKDIINLQHPTSKRHPRMSMYNRAAQFSPFAALTGHDAAIREVARYTENEIERDESATAELERTLSALASNLDEKPVVSITYFKKDPLKSGGSYITVKCIIKRIDEYEHNMIIDDGTIVNMSSIADIK